jgi:23S rRNA (cytidine1920-2'-O)/16S rRNA (cytidine1409-2'-O)-methyltransferase
VIRQRLDEALVARQLYPSRARARDAILRGTILVDGEPARKPSQMVLQSSALTTADAAQAYVSRSALKLIHALDHFKIDPAGRDCLDIGASTGGFTQVLLQRGAHHVYAIDVGHGQMMLEGPKITLHEGLNARDIEPEHMSPQTSLILCDVSFIPLHIALPKALSLVEVDTELVALIKPQFEVGRQGVTRGGMVKDVAAHARVCAEVSAFLTASGWQVQGVIPSPMDGGDGNLEFLVAAQKRQTTEPGP